MADIYNRKVKEIYWGDDANVDCGCEKAEADHVEVIDYHEPRGPGDAHFADVTLKTGEIRRIFCLTEVLFYPCKKA